MKPGDIRIDFDLLANALAGTEPDNHDHADLVKKITKAARDAAIRAAKTHATDTDVWLIHGTPAPSTLDRYRREGAEIITVDPGREVVMHRIKEQRPKYMHGIAARWYQQQGDDKPKPKQAHERGYDWNHRRNRARLMYNLVDGTPCPGCGNPMYKDPARNHDGAALEADHTRDLKHHGPSQADRLLCRTCNRSRGDGHDERLPVNKAKREAEQAAAYGPTGWDWLG